MPGWAWCRAALFLSLKIKLFFIEEEKLEVKVIDNDVEKALKILKNKLSKSGLFKELKVRRAYEKPSVKKKRKSIEARRRLAKVQRRRSN